MEPIDEFQKKFNNHSLNTEVVFADVILALKEAEDIFRKIIYLNPNDEMIHSSAAKIWLNKWIDKK